MATTKPKQKTNHKKRHCAITNNNIQHYWKEKQCDAVFPRKNATPLFCMNVEWAESSEKIQARESHYIFIHKNDEINNTFKRVTKHPENRRVFFMVKMSFSGASRPLISDAEDSSDDNKNSHSNINNNKDLDGKKRLETAPNDNQVGPLTSNPTLTPNHSPQSAAKRLP